MGKTHAVQTAFSLPRIRSLAEERQLVVEDWFPPEQQSRFKYLISTVSWKLTSFFLHVEWGREGVGQLTWVDVM